MRWQLKARLLARSPCAFERFASDVLTYLGIANVAVTRPSGDGGVDAHGELVRESRLVRVPPGMPVKRHRSIVQHSAAAGGHGPRGRGGGTATPPPAWGARSGRTHAGLRYYSERSQS